MWSDVLILKHSTICENMKKENNVSIIAAKTDENANDEGLIQYKIYENENTMINAMNELTKNFTRDFIKDKLMECLSRNNKKEINTRITVLACFWLIEIDIGLIPIDIYGSSFLSDLKTSNNFKISRPDV